MMAGLLARIKTGALVALAFVMAIVGAWWAGRKGGKQDQQAEHDRRDLTEQAKADNHVAEVQNDVNKLPTGGASDELRRKWMRRKG